MFGEDKFIMGAEFIDQPENKFFMYKTIYDTIIDLDEKIKKSFRLAIEWEYQSDIKEFNMFLIPSEEEREAIYYTENAIFRTSVLWDLLAQLYNIRNKNNENPEKVYYKTLFHNETQGSQPNEFAAAVYSYISEAEDENDNQNPDGAWRGNHKYVVDYRNKMTHRNSPNVSSASSYAIQLRMPMRYVLKRSIEDYCVAADFIQKLMAIILLDYDNTDNKC